MARTGRPREFDREKAIVAALDLFWEQGYEPTSLAQLRSSMGNISSASFYAAFGSKEALFREVVARYQSSYGQVTATLKDDRLPPKEAIEHALMRSAEMQTDPSHPPGCLMILGANNCTPENQHIDHLLAADRARNRKGIEDCIRRGVATGDLASSVNVEALATAFHTFLLGMAMETKDQVDRQRIRSSVKSIMLLWDANRPASRG